MKSIHCTLPVLLAALACAPRASAQDIGACLKQLRGEALGRGISTQTFDTALAGVEADSSVLEAMDNQPEFKIPVWDYLAVLVDAQRIEDGRARLVEWAPVLARAEEKYGVDRHTLVALWGVESDYGRQLGGRPLVRSLATVSCLGRRQAYFRGEFIATLRILQSGDMPAEALTGSWAGAFGQTQFMPSTYERVAVDFDGDGRRDIVASVPDALGSSANYLLRSGWQRDTSWGYEVRLPEGYRGPSGRRTRNELREWRRLGLRNADGSELAGAGSAALLLPAGRSGPAFLVSRNFNAIYSYNASESYALAIAHLSDRLRGGGAFVAAWPTDDPGLSRAERREVQERLIARGHEIGAADGAIGPRTRQAIEAFQATAGLAVDGRAGQKLLRALRQP
ncbi:MAG: lytic murein transglycosylase [Betaproteobacteria bacterium]|nr:lytic murein transglycosylase [Betaproteobacteria bacterium]